MPEVKLPPLGEGADTGTVVNILVKEGDQIAKGQNIIELETGKAVAPIPSSAAGTVQKIAVTAGSKLSVGQTILSLSGDGTAGKGPSDQRAKTPAGKPAAKARTEEAPEEDEGEADQESGESAESSSQFPPAAAPSVRRVARDLGIDLRKIKGSENGGRIVLGDLRNYVQRLQKLSAQGRPASAGAAGGPGKAASTSLPDFSKWGQIAKRPMTALRKVISQRMTENWNAIPHVTQFEEADITRLMELRKKFAEAYEKKGAKLTITPFVIKAVIQTLKAHPAFNSSLDETAEEVIYKEYFHIGIAVDTDQGLIVPVIRDADKKDLASISREVNGLAEKARDRKLSMEELQGGTFTISNQGGIGGGHFTPIINKPEVAILGVGRGALKPVVRDQRVESRLMLPLALSYDHRVIDGGSAVRFMIDLVKALENFEEKEAAL